MVSSSLDARVDASMQEWAKIGYCPTRFVGMRKRIGTRRAIARLVERGDAHTGFMKLQKVGLLDYSLEAAVSQLPDEFSNPVRSAATFRLAVAHQIED